jgi:hypothetical protein
MQVGGPESCWATVTMLRSTKRGASLGHAGIMARDYLGRNRQPVASALFFSRRNA